MTWSPGCALAGRRSCGRSAVRWVGTGVRPRNRAGLQVAAAGRWWSIIWHAQGQPRARPTLPAQLTPPGPAPAPAAAAACCAACRASTRRFMRSRSACASASSAGGSVRSRPSSALRREQGAERSVFFRLSAYGTTEWKQQLWRQR